MMASYGMIELGQHWFISCLVFWWFSCFLMVFLFSDGFLNQCRLNINGVLWYSPRTDLKESAQNITIYIMSRKITFISPRGHWVKQININPEMLVIHVTWIRACYLFRPLRPRLWAKYPLSPVRGSQAGAVQLSGCIGHLSCVCHLSMLMGMVPKVMNSRPLTDSLWE